MFKSKLSKVIVLLLRRVLRVTRSGAKRLMRAMLRSLMAMGRRARLPVAGFVLPTVTMVLLVVILLTVAITLRSFDRANTARNVRVNQQVLAAATPALDRAKAKIEYMLREDPQRPTATPSDAEMYRIMSSYPANPTAADPDFYTFAGEERLVLRADLDDNGTPDPTPANLRSSLFSAPNRENEELNTAWRYPVDTNNDGIFDTFTLYGIYFRTPKTTRTRRELDARTPPMRTGTINPACTQGQGTVASLVGDSGWERLNGRFQKSFFVYTVNVPITQDDMANGLNANQFQVFSGTPSISALEYQQDQSRIPLSNNAVVYEDDLEISPGPSFNLNGRIFTNSNFLVTVLNSANTVQLYQVSSKQSCFYDQENSRIVVGGNVVNGWSDNTTDNAQINPVRVDIFKSQADTDEPNADGLTINSATNQSVAENSLAVLYNNNAYSQRLAALVNAQLANAAGTDPTSVQQAMLAPKSQSRAQALQDYFKERLRKVPFAENAALPPPPFIEGAGDTLRPRDALNWSIPNGTATVGSVAGPTGLTIRPDQLPAEDPAKLKLTDSENFLGNRVTVGNNLPALRWNGTSFTNEDQQVDGTTTWANNGPVRTRTPQVTKIADVGATDRGNGVGEAPNPANPFQDGFWEKSAAEQPRTPLDGVGGLRVITSAGVYDRTNSFLPPPTWIDGTGTLRTGPASVAIPPVATTNTYDDPETAAVEEYRVVWPDSMPMSPLGPGSQVWNNGTALAGAPAVAPGNWVNWDTATWSPPVAPPALPDATGLPAADTNPNNNFVAEDPATARKFAKGDLRMRATAVYHYANSGFNPVALAAAPAGTQPTQAPFACVSSYYDPSNASTARNILTGALPDVSGQGALAPDVATRDAGLGAQQTFIGSNNGITYNPPTRLQSAVPASILNPATGLLGGGDVILEAQANMVFPDGRFANGPLRTALQVAPAARTLAQQAAIDSTNCALQILDASIVPNSALIPNGAIQEVAFINGREVKAVDRDDPNTIVNEAFTLSSPLGTAAPAAQLTGNYNQPLEEREPLEIRATQLDINALRGTNIAGPNTTVTEWLLPNSGIIYAGRDDALPDRSSRSTNSLTDKTLSPTDNRLDPTRKPNGIVLINGQVLFRGAGNTPITPTDLNAVVREKGLTLVSNLPAYIKGNFNLHGNIPPADPANPTPEFTQVEEFTDTVDPDWGNFYTRTELDSNFACRAGDPRLPNCTVGDFWRQATVLADAVTLLSQNYRFGFRNEGDFDLRNNAGAAAVLPRRQQGFYNNNFVTNGLSSGAFSDNGNLVGAAGASATPLTDATYVAQPNLANLPLSSSYFNNFVTPVQRREALPEYVMEVCTKLPVSECTDADWFVDLRASGQTAKTLLDAGTPYTSPDPVNPGTSTFQAGSTVDPPLPELQRFPRRVAFDRTASPPQPLAITDAAGTITAGGNGRLGTNALWFAQNNGGNAAYTQTNPLYLVNIDGLSTGNIDGSRVPLPTWVAAGSTTPLPQVTTVPAAPYDGSQPLLMPFPQFLGVTGAPDGLPQGTNAAQGTGWVSHAVADTTFNLIVGSGDTPSRALDTSSGDFNGGLQNFPRFLEIWSDSSTGTAIATNIRGSFVQQNRSAFSTAPYQPILPQNFPADTVAQLASLFALSPDPAGQPAILANPPNSLSPTGYNIQGGRIPYFTPPARNWGFDVGLLSQPPDLFTQKFTTPSTKTQPAEYFREVGRNDPWVTTLMCGRVAPDQPTNANQVATSTRPAGCPT
ncbi:hormogonium polysaccharide biosynthesis protein HpsA [Microcoleus sp. F10-C6]|uniref:hormogonium polysaccharide biosynthesis protein HpsA n=1 Tax=unclassified Microcoleus TaxID=2642155 RepID=UPI002FD65608